MNRLVDYFRRNAEDYPDKSAVICHSGSMTYAALWQAVQDHARSQPTDRAHLIRATQDADFLVRYLASQLAGSVAVPLEKDLPDLRRREIETLLTEAELPVGTADILFTTGTTGQSKGVMLSHEAIVANAENLAEAQQFSPDLTFVIAGPLNHIGSLSKVWPTLLTG